mmetsp:Transcript_107346/g.334588  ORF Transcript_107346/g.334588 Transcript_107346/m.334588 type:complete len:257 (-) Transcript_107346:1762-2532(-)
MGKLQSSWSSTRGGMTENSASMSFATTLTSISPAGSYCACRSRSICAMPVLLSTRMPLWNVREAARVSMAASGRGSPVSTCLDMERMVDLSYAHRSKKYAGISRTSYSIPCVPAARPSVGLQSKCRRVCPTVWKSLATSSCVSSAGPPSALGRSKSQTTWTAGRRCPDRASPSKGEYSWITSTQKPGRFLPLRRKGSRKNDATNAPVSASRKRKKRTCLSHTCASPSAATVSTPKSVRRSPKRPSRTAGRGKNSRR